MKPALIVMATFAFAVSGCAGMDYAVDHYKGVPIQHFTDHNQTPWRIFDKPEQGRLMITPSIGRSIGMGIFEGLTFMAADTEIPKPTYQMAVEEFLASTKRNCTVTEAYKIIEPQWEFKYTCEAVGTSATP